MEHTPTIEEVLEKHMEDRPSKIIDESYLESVYDAMQDWASIETEHLQLEMAELRRLNKILIQDNRDYTEGTEQLRRENTELKELPNELNRWINQEIDTAEAKLKTLSPLGKHALQAPIKAQIALLKEIIEKFKIKSI